MLKIWYFEDCEFNQVDPIFQHFKRVGWLRFDNVVDADTKLDILKRSNVDAVEELDFNMLNIQSLEEISDPQYFNYSILSLRYSETRWGCLNDSILHNISKINPRKLYQLILILLKVLKIKY